MYHVGEQLIHVLVNVTSVTSKNDQMFFHYRSTDSQLKLWGTTKPHCLRTFRGHTNEKNFVGLATDRDYIACGKLIIIVM